MQENEPEPRRVDPGSHSTFGVFFNEAVAAGEAD